MKLSQNSLENFVFFCRKKILNKIFGDPRKKVTNTGQIHDKPETIVIVCPSFISRLVPDSANDTNPNLNQSWLFDVPDWCRIWSKCKHCTKQSACGTNLSQNNGNFKISPRQVWKLYQIRRVWYRLGKNKL